MRTEGDCGLALKLKHTRKSKKRSPIILLAHVPLWRRWSPISRRCGGRGKQYLSLKCTSFLTSDTSTTMLIPLVPTPTTHVPLSHTFTYDHHLPVPLLELSAICVDTVRHVSCVRAAELGLAVSSERPLDAPTSPVRTKMHMPLH